MPSETDTSRLDLLITAHHLVPFLGEFGDRLERAGCRLHIPRRGDQLHESDLLALAPGMTAIVCGDNPITRAVLDAAPTLQVICKWGTGLDSIDVAEARKRGVSVLNTRDAFSQPVADTALGYVFYFARSLGRNDRAVRRGEWNAQPARSLAECILGVIGVGDIGALVLRRAVSLGIRCLAYDVDPKRADLARSLGAEWVALEQLLQESDFVSLHCSLTHQSRGIISRKQLAQMKVSSYIINTSRGALIDEGALVDAVRSRRISGAALDVFESEPIGASSPLLLLDNVMLSPHAANQSPRYHRSVSENTVNILLAALNRAG